MPTSTKPPEERRAYKPRRQCKGNGGTCGRAPMNGLDVCEAHGGRLPAVKEKALKTVQEARQMVLEQHVPAALDRLAAIMANADTADRDVIAAARALLKAAGVEAGANIKVDVEITPPMPESQRQAQISRILELTQRAEATAIGPAWTCPECARPCCTPRVQRGELLPAPVHLEEEAEPVIVDAEVVDDAEAGLTLADLL